MKKILVFGSLNFDNIYRVPHITAAGETQASTDMTIRLGGKGYNQAAAACKSGGAVWLAGCIGTDGKPFLDACSKLGIHAELVKTVPDCKTGHAVIQVSEEGENSILLFGGANQRQDRAYIDHVLSKFDRGDYLMLQNEVNELPYLIDRAYEIGMKIVMNPSPFNDIILKCDLDKVSWLLVNEIECRQILEADCDEKPVEQLRRKYPGCNIVVTLGKNGARCWIDGQAISQRAFSVTPVDTTGAGDCFTGYLIGMTAAGYSCQDALRTATAASALCITRPGAAESVPTYAEVQAALRGSIEPTVRS